MRRARDSYERRLLVRYLHRGQMYDDAGLLAREFENSGRLARQRRVRRRREKAAKLARKAARR